MKGLRCLGDWDPRYSHKINQREYDSKIAARSCEVWKNPRLFLENDVAIPEPSSEEVLVRVKSCGICGSDLSIVKKNEDGYTAFSGRSRMGIIMGHEISGEIVEMGKNVRDFEIGDSVAIQEGISCGKCDACRSGFPDQCYYHEGVGITRDGGFAEYVAVPAKTCWKINSLRNVYNNDRIFDAGSLVQPLSVCYHAIFECCDKFRPGGIAVIVGAGPIGLLSTALMRSCGASAIVVLDVVDERLELAKKCGADIVVNPSQAKRSGSSLNAVVQDISDGKGANIIVEAAGAANLLIDEMIAVAAVNCQIVLVAAPNESVKFDIPRFQAKRVEVYSALGDIGRGCFGKVINLLNVQRIDPTTIVTAYFPLDEAIAAFDHAANGICGKVIIHP